jgi:signal transduction histidine kinase
MASSNSHARDLSIKHKLTLIILLTSGAALLMACLGFALYDYFTFREEKVRELASFAEIISASSAKTLSQMDGDAAGEIFGSLPSDRNILAACLYSREGDLLTGYIARGEGGDTCPGRSPAPGHQFEENRLEFTQSVVLAGVPTGTVYLVSGLEEIRHRMLRYTAISGLVLLASILVAFVLSARLRKMISDPLLELAEAARSISQEQDYSVRVPKHGADEVGLLTKAFNDMLSEIQSRDEELQRAHGELEQRVEERTTQLVKETSSRHQAEEALKESEEALRQSQKMEAIGRLAGGVAHDFNNLLTAIMGYTDMMVGPLNDSDPMKAQLLEIRKASHRAANLTRQLLAFSRKQVLDPKVLTLNRAVSELENMLRRLIGEDIELITVLGENLGRIKADPGQIEQVILNLAVNARDAMPEGGRLVIETANLDVEPEGEESLVWAPAGSYVMLQISDTGGGMDEETRSRVFEPFFTTKDKSKGTGLGLSTVYGIVTQSGGHISVQSKLGQGTCFRILFPLVTQEAEPISELAEEVAPAGGSETILLVEDEQLVRDLTRGILMTHGYKVLEAPHGGEALLLCESYTGPIHLMLTDVVMPNLSGPDLYQRVSPLKPEMPVLYMSGYTGTEDPRKGKIDPSDPFIQKPFTPEALARKVREVIDQNPRAGHGAPVEGIPIVAPPDETDEELVPVLSLDIPEEL